MPVRRRQRRRRCCHGCRVQAELHRHTKWTSVQVASIVCGCLFLMLILFSLSNNPCASDEIEFNSEIKINVDTLKFLQSLFDQQMTNLNLQRTIKGNILQREKELLVWAQLPHMPHITTDDPTICEIGFAYGMSAVAILSQHSTVKYVGFEIGHASMDAVWDIVHGNYPDRTRLEVGDSSTKIRELASAGTDITCDAWIIDGGHSYEAAKKDLDAILDTVAHLSNANSLILWDDCDCGDASGHVDAAVIEREWPTEGLHQKSWSKGPTKVFTEAVVDGRLQYLGHGTETDSKGRFVGWCMSQLADSD